MHDLSRPDGTPRWSVTHLTVDPVDRETLAALAVRWLPAGEQRRAAEMAPGARRSTFVIGRLLARSILGRSLNVSAPDVVIRRGAGGRLRTQEPWHVSLSHSGSGFLLASATAPVGVDLESTAFWNEKLVRRFQLVPQATMERAEPSRASAVAQAWTIREACVKATGGGLADIRRSRPGEGRCGSWEGYEWEVLALPEGYGTVAIKGLDLRPGRLNSATLSVVGGAVEVHITGETEVASPRAS